MEKQNNLIKVGDLKLFDDFKWLEAKNISDWCSTPNNCSFARHFLAKNCHPLLMTAHHKKAPAKYAYQMFNRKCMEVHFMHGPLASFAMLWLLDLQFWNKSVRKQKAILKRIVIAWFSQVRKTDLRDSLSGVVLIGRFDMNCIDCYNGVYRKDLENVVHLSF